MKVIFGLTCQSTLYPKLKAHNTTTLTYINNQSKKDRVRILKQKAAENLKNMPLLLEQCAKDGIFAFRISDSLIPMADLGEYDYE